jgi:hypothetical protein
LFVVSGGEFLLQVVQRQLEETQTLVSQLLALVGKSTAITEKPKPCNPETNESGWVDERKEGKLKFELNDHNNSINNNINNKNNNNTDMNPELNANPTSTVMDSDFRTYLIAGAHDQWLQFERSIDQDVQSAKQSPRSAARQRKLTDYFLRS